MTGGRGISQLEGIFRLRFDYAQAQKGRTFYRPWGIIALQPGLGSVQANLDELRAFAISRLNRLRDVLADTKAIDEVRALLAERMGKFTLERVSEGGKISFKPNGEIDLFGEEAVTQL